MSFAHKIRVGVLRGGPSPEYDVSLKTGGNILANLPEEYEPIDIFISKNGVWHEKGLEKNPENILGRMDVIINGLHGKYGEDGEVQKLMDHFGVPYTGSGAFASALAMNKIASKRIYKNNSLKTPAFVSIPFENLSKKAIRSAYESMLSPFVVKPSAAGSSLGMYIVNSLPELEEAVIAASVYSPAVLIEEYIKGKEVACGVIEGFRKQDFYNLLPLGNFSADEKIQIQETAVLIHKILGLRHYSYSDFIIHPRRGLFVLEVNSLPEITHRSSFIKSLEAVGGNIKEFLSHLLSQTLRK